MNLSIGSIKLHSGQSSLSKPAKPPTSEERTFRAVAGREGLPLEELFNRAKILGATVFKVDPNKINKDEITNAPTVEGRGSQELAETRNTVQESGGSVHRPEVQADILREVEGELENRGVAKRGE